MQFEFNQLGRRFRFENVVVALLATLRLFRREMLGQRVEPVDGHRLRFNRIETLFDVRQFVKCKRRTEEETLIERFDLGQRVRRFGRGVRRRRRRRVIQRRCFQNATGANTPSSQRRQ